MPRATKDTKLDTQSARAKLAAQREPYWHKIDRGTHLGYRKGKTGGRWIARTRSPAGKYVFSSLGNADDARDADGAGVLDFYQAQDQARKWFKRQAIEESGDSALLASINGPYTVAKAMRDYLTYYEAHRKQSGLEYARCVSDAFILPEFGKLEVAKLRAPRIRKWHDALAVSSARVRSAKDGPVRHRAAPKDSDERRARKSSANRVLTVLKAALNRAYQDGYAESAEAWRRVKPFAGVDQARIRYLGEDECKRLVNACELDFRTLVEAAYPLLKASALAGGSGKSAIEAPLVMAMVRQESAFNPRATSGAGARGLMQLLPRTAYTVARRLKVRYSRSRLTSDSRYNLRLGQAYIAGLVQKYDGSYVLALAAYNAGPSRTDKWMRNNGDPRDGSVDVIDWIEMIPFDETRNYIQRVLENLQVYRRRLADRDVALMLESDLRR